MCCTPLAPAFRTGLSAPSALMAPRSMPQPLPTDACNDVLLHRDTGSAALPLCGGQAPAAPFAGAGLKGLLSGGN